MAWEEFRLRWAWVVRAFLLAANSATAGFVDDPVFYQRLKEQVPQGVRFAMSAMPANGDFSAGLSQWVATGTVATAAGEAILGDQTAPTTLLYQPVAVTPGDYVLTFDVQGDLAPNPGQGSFPDTFFASLYFTTNPAAFDIASSQFDGVLSLIDLDAGGFTVLTGSVGPSPLGAPWSRYTLPFTSAYAYVVPAFELADIDGTPGNSEVRIDNVLIVVPEPTTIALALLGLAAIAVRRLRGPLVLALLALATSAGAQTPFSLADHFVVRTANERSTLDRRTGEIVSTVDVSIVNLGGREVRSPLHAVINLSTGGVQAVGALGGPTASPYNRFYIDLSQQMPQGRLLANASLSFPLVFRRDRNVVFSYEIEPYGLLKEERAPSVVVPPGPFAVDEGGSLQIPVTASDPDGDVVVLSATPAISNASFVGNPGASPSGMLTFGPEFDQAGFYTVQFVATDPLGLASSTGIVIEVRNVNRGPELGALVPREVSEGDLLVVAWDVTDPDGDAFQWILPALPPNAVFAPETGTFVFAPDFDQSGVYNLPFAVSDGSQTSTIRTLSVTVVDVPASPPSATNAFTLQVDPIISPTLARSQRVTGTVNGSTNGPPREPSRAALITGVSPSTGRRGQTLDVVITGLNSGLFATQFSSNSVASFGPDIVVISNRVLGATQVVATITIPLDTPTGSRDVTVATGGELALSVVAFHVSPGTTSLTGKLLDPDTGLPIAGAIVTVQGTGFRTTTAPDGTFTLNGVPPGRGTLIINPQNHEVLTLVFTAENGVVADLGEVKSPPTVFDAAAPAGVSLLSVIGRGLGGFAVTDPESTKQAMRDAMVLVGGSEAGVVDAFGNQLNPSLDGYGLLSLRDDGLRILADGMERGESVGLADVLYAFSHAFVWTNGAPLTLGEWIDGLQERLDAAWVDPRNPSNALPLVVFNRGRTLGPIPPVLRPETRLNSFQTFLLVHSLLSYAFDPAGTTVVARAVSPPHSRSFPWIDAAYADPPPGQPSAGRRWTSYWRGFDGAKQNFITGQINAAGQQFVELSAFMLLLAGTGDLATTLVGLPIIGVMENNIVAAFASIALAARVPAAPRMDRAEIVPGPNGAPRVRVHFKPSAGDAYDGLMLHALYRFRAPNEGRQLVALDSFRAAPNAVSGTVYLTDLAPFPGSTFYAVSAIQLRSADDLLTETQINNTTPWWNVLTQGSSDVLQGLIASRQRLVSDYSDPAVIFVGSASTTIPVSDIEVDPVSEAVFYSVEGATGGTARILRAADLGDGDATNFSFTGFATPGHEGLGIDGDGNLYTLNAASQAKFGGRLFRFDADTGNRSHVGQVNYFSQLLQFANPTDAYVPTIGPAASGLPGDEDLYVVDMLDGFVKRAPVRATYDPFRRVAQPYVALPYTGKPIDMEHDDEGNTYLLLADARPRKEFRDREKGTMHIPPGAPVKQSDCPEDADVFADPVYPFSGEFYESVEDLRLKGRGLDFVWNRKYRSKIGVGTNTVLGNNWDHSYNIFITRNTNTGGIVVYDGNTRSDEYARSGTNDLWTLPEFFRELKRNGDGTYTLEFEDRGVWNFHGFTGAAVDGRVKESIDRHGNRLQFFYDGLGRLDRVNDTLGRDILIAYNAEGRVDRLLDFTGRMTRYEYFGAGDPNGNPGDLKAVITPAVTGTPTTNDFPFGKRISYTYSTGFTNAALNGNLLTITDGRRNDTNDATFGQGPYVRNVYSTTGDVNAFTFDRVVRQVWGNEGDIIDFVYVEVQPTRENGGAVSKTIINDRVGNVLEYFYNVQNQCTLRRIYTGRANPLLPTTDTQNRPSGKLRATDPDYFETKFVWNADSLKTREIHPNGNITEWVYESDLDPQAPARTRANIRVVRHLQGTHSVTGDQQVIEERFEYDTSFGRGCCGFNFVTRELDGRGNETRRFYDSVGNLTSVVQRVASSREDFTYNPFGQMTSLRHPDNGSGHRRLDRMEYYGPGDGHQNGYLKRVVTDEGNANLATTYEYDARGNPVRVTNARGFATEHVYNQLDQVVRTLTPALTNGSLARYSVDTFYDANNNIVRTETLNIGPDGTVDPLNPTWTKRTEFEILNLPVRRFEEVRPNEFVVGEMAYDKNRNLILKRFGEAVAGRQPRNEVRYEYDERDLLFREIRAPGDARQVTSQNDYDGNRNPVRMSDGLEQASPRVTETRYDAFDRKVRQVDPMGNVSRWSYDANGNPVVVRTEGELVDVPGSAGNVRLSEAWYGYDALNRMTSTVALVFHPATQAAIGDGQAVTIRQYSDNHQITLVRDDNGHAIRSVYDTMNRLSQVIDHLSNTTVFVYDESGNTVSTVKTERPDGGGSPAVYVASTDYDSIERPIRNVDNATNITRLAYDSRSNLRRVIDARGNVTSHEFDGLNRLVATTHFLTDTGDGAGVVTTQLVIRQTWDDSSRMLTRTDGNGNATAYAYDALGRQTNVTLADGKTQQIVYDANDNVIRWVDPNGTVVTQQYDLLDRVVRVDVAPAAGVTGSTFEVHEYDGASRLVRASDNDATNAWTYDSFSRKLTEAWNGLSTTSTFDEHGNRLKLQYPGGRVLTNEYDALDRRREIRDGQGLVAAYTYAGPLRVATRRNGNNTEWQLGYDGVRRITSSRHVRDPAGAATVVDDRRFAWDRVNNKVSRSDQLLGITHAYAYDSLNRLVRSDVTTPATIQYALDLVGNRLAVTGGPSAGAYSLSPTLPEPADRQRNQYTATPGDTLAYDANGNLVSINAGGPGERLMRYDFRNRMVEFRRPSSGLIVRFAYDAIGRRTQKVVSGPGASTTSYLYDGGRVIEERDAANSVAATYAYGHYEDERISMTRGGQTYYYHADDLHNVMLMTDASGAVVERYEYGDYGAPLVFNGSGNPLAGSAIGNPYLFTGREFDPETAWYWYRTRYMDPVIGRFTSPDSIGQWGDARSLGNAYTYAGNNPWSALDPQGQNALTMAGGFGVGLMQTVGDLVSGLAHLPGLLLQNPADFCSGMKALIDQVFGNPNGPMCGLAKTLFPEIYRDWICWDSISDYRKGKVMGRVVGEILLTLATSGGGGAVKGGAKGAAMMDAMGTTGATMAKGRTLSNRASALMKQDLIEALRGVGGNAAWKDELLRAADDVTLAVVSADDMAMLAEGTTLGKGASIAALYNHSEKTIFLNSGFRHPKHNLLSVFAHELKHAADYARYGENAFGSVWGKMALEVRAHTAQYMVEALQGMRTMPTFLEIETDVFRGYFNALHDKGASGALRMGGAAADYDPLVGGIQRAL